jgi:teichuronic acid biosynthesis glycosyltransferase TuaG
MTGELVSIIVPVFNAERFLSSAIESVMAQSYINWELILVDDCSTDRSYEIAQTYEKADSRIILMRLNRNSGTAIARSTALERAKGKYIAFIDSDDIWLHEKLETQLKFMNNRKLVFTFSSYYVINEAGVRTSCFDVPGKVSYSDLLHTNSVGNLTAIYDAEFFGKVSLVKRKYEDYILWLDLLKKIPYTYSQREYLAEYRKYGSSYSSNKFKAVIWQWNIYRHVENLNIVKSMYYLIFYTIHGLFKYKKL